MSEADDPRLSLDESLRVVERHYIDELDADELDAIKLRIRVHLLSGLEPDFTELMTDLQADHPMAGHLASVIVHESLSLSAEVYDEHAPIKAERPFTADEQEEGARLQRMLLELGRFIKGLSVLPNQSR